MLKIDTFNKSIQGQPADNSSKTENTGKTRKQGDKPEFNVYNSDIKPRSHLYDKDDLLNVIKQANTIEDAIRHISEDIVDKLFYGDSIFSDKSFIDRVKQDLAEHFVDDPLAQEILHSLK